MRAVPAATSATGATRLSARGLGLAREVDGPRLLEGVDLTLRGGECVLLQGATGSGKSTLLRALAGLPGVACLDGGIERDGPIALLGQHVETQLLCPTVGEEVGIGLRGEALPDEVKRARIERALRDVALVGFETRESDALSAGQRQRVVLAALLALEPRTLLLDEPLSSLDAPSRRALTRVLARLKQRGAAILVAEHAPRELLGLVDRVLRIEAGRVRVGPATDRGAAPESGAAAGHEAGAEAGATARAIPLPRSLDALSPGARLLIEGPNGAGKSTHLRALAQAGSERGSIAWVIQEPRRALFARTVRGELAFGLDRLAPGVLDRDARIERLLARFDLSGCADRSPRRLSFGQQHRLAIAAALAARPAFVLLDEPFAGLDAGARDALLAALEEEQRDTGVGIVIASHDRAPLDRWCRERVELRETPRRPGPSAPPVRPLQYRSGASRLHVWAPGPKAACVLVLGVVALLLESPLALLGLLGLVALAYPVAGLGADALWRDLRWIVLQGLILVALTVLLRGAAGWASGSRAALQIALVFLPAALFVRTTPMERVLDGLARWLPEPAGFAIGATLRFAPLFVRELGELVEMQRLRGASLAWRAIARPRSWRDALACVAVPMTLRAIEVANEAADAARIRGIGGDRAPTGSVAPNEDAEEG